MKVLISLSAKTSVVTKPKLTADQKQALKERLVKKKAYEKELKRKFLKYGADMEKKQLAFSESKKLRNKEASLKAKEALKKATDRYNSAQVKWNKVKEDINYISYRLAGKKL